MYIIIVGGGKVGHSLAKHLSQDKHTIVLIDKDREACKMLAQELNNVVVVCGDGCEPMVLEEAKIDRADVVAAVTGGDEDNLVICQIAKEKFKVRRTVARVNDPNNEHTFSELGVDIPIDATSIIAKIIEEETS
ncbi:MAG: NAD-binding protein, partial [Candidatus Omnitrophica bacterium]|nr:NAD-binding protein [Candidatus Omnitrophota bacterium]